MKARTFAAIGVVAAAGAVIAVKAARHRPAEGSVVSSTTSLLAPSVVLVADPREADSDCGCGQIIRRVREAKARGVQVQEMGPSDPAASRYGVTVAPTVLVLGSDGRVVSRREGESSEVLAAISAELARLEGPRR